MMFNKRFTKSNPNDPTFHTHELISNVWYTNPALANYNVENAPIGIGSVFPVPGFDGSYDGNSARKVETLFSQLGKSYRVRAITAGTLVALLAIWAYGKSTKFTTNQIQ